MIKSFIKRVESTSISARMINRGPTVLRTNRLKEGRGIDTGAPVKHQNRIGCSSGKNFNVEALASCLTTALAVEIT
jgi:hypothetical protein